jgi:hypothetical protein
MAAVADLLASTLQELPDGLRLPPG